MTVDHKMISLWAQMYIWGDTRVVERQYDQLCEFFADEMPYGTVKARDGDPYEWLGSRLERWNKGM